VAIKHELVRGYLRLVVSVARKHLGTGAGRSEALAELIAEGNLVLLEAVETFDAGRGTRFTTYLTWALMKRFAAANRAQTRHKAATLSATAATVGGATAPEDWPMAMNPALAGGEHARDLARALHDLLGELDERERIIITRHFGLPDGDGKAAEPQTLAQLAQQLKISAERARQIEHRAMLKLRDAARRIGLDDELDEPPTGRPGHVAS
jgi:RNA polymerase primary sigma factor/RNA polymerase sigma factor